MWDMEQVRAGLVAGPVMAEPLVRDGRQAVRVECAGAPARLVLDGAVVDAPSAPVSGGAVRFLVPAVDRPTPLRVVVSGRDAVELLLPPPRRWTVHLIHHSHLDIGYTDVQRRVLAEHGRYLDACLDLAERTRDWPDDARFRWTVEALWPFLQWARSRDPARVRTFLDLVRAGEFELTALPYSLHTEACSVDELHELLRPARELGVEVPVAMQTDVPGMAVGAVDALAQAGVRYLSVAHNWAGRSVPHLLDGHELPRLFRWRAPSGASVLVWVTDTAHGQSYLEGNMLGLDAGYSLTQRLLPAYLAALGTRSPPYPPEPFQFGWQLAGAGHERAPYPWDVVHLRVGGRFVDNAPPSLRIAEVVREWNARWDWPRLRCSRNVDFFAAVEGEEIETFEGDWTDWWADGLGSAAQLVATGREAQRALADARTLGGLAALLGGSGVDDPGPAYEALGLFDEHTWGAANPWNAADRGVDAGGLQWHWKAGHALAAAERAEGLGERAAARVVERLGRPEAALASVYVFNPCGWARTDLVRAFLPDATVTGAVQVRDARTGEAVPADEERGGEAEPRLPGRELMFAAEDVPPCGYVRFDVVAGPSGAASPERAASGEARLATDHFAVEVDLADARLAFVRDLATGRELVRPGELGFNGYLYERYGTTGGVNHLSSAVTADGLALLASRHAGKDAALIERRSTAVAETLTYELRPPGADSVRTTVTLPRAVPRVDIVNRVAKRFTMDKESAFFAFPFALDAPRVRFAVTGGTAGPDLPAVPGSARHMRAIRRWASLEEDGYAIAWITHDAPLIQHGALALPYVPFPTSLPATDATLFSWIHNNIWDTNFPPGQAFDMAFRYSLAGGPAARAAAAGEHPLIAIVTARPEPAAASQASFVSTNDEPVEVLGLAALGERRLLVNLQSQAERAIEVPLSVPAGTRAARRATLRGEPLEELDVEDGSVRVELAPCAVTGVLLDLA